MKFFKFPLTVDSWHYIFRSALWISTPKPHNRANNSSCTMRLISQQYFHIFLIIEHEMNTYLCVVCDVRLYSEGTSIHNEMKYDCGKR